MRLHSMTGKVYRSLKNSEALSDCRVIMAFPYIKKPTRLTKTVITVSPAGAVLKGFTLGEKSVFGDFSVNIDMFTPQEKGSPSENGLLDLVTQAALSLEPTSIKLGGFNSNDVLGAFEAQCTVTFSDTFDTEDS